jgi:TPR repeat protein
MGSDEEIWKKEPNWGALTEAYKLLEKSPTKAMSELEALSAQGSTMSMVYLGTAYRDGVAGKPDTLKAEYWYRQAGERGHPWMSRIGDTFVETWRKC